MNITISPEVLGKQLNQLASYQQWNEATQAEHAAFALVPRRANVNSPDYLNKQLRALDTKKETDAAQSDLLLEIGEQDDSFAPLHYRLGALAAFASTRVFEGQALGMPTFGEIRQEDRLYVSSNPIFRAIQIGDELNALVSVLDSAAPVPVTMVQNDYCVNCRINDNRVISGEIEEPEHALEISPPEVSELNRSRYVTFSVPTILHGVSKLVRYHGHHTWYPPEIDSFSSEKPKDGVISSPIPHLERLTKNGSSRRHVDALYIGEKALVRASCLPALDGPNAVPFPDRSRGYRATRSRVLF